MTQPTRSHRLSKSRFVTGCQCHKLLWWKVHEPQAKELEPGVVLQDRFDQGQQVGEMAQDRFPDGVLIDFPYQEVDAMIAATKTALDDGAAAIFEASFLADSVFVAVDVLQRDGDGFTLIEVKSSSSQKPEHIPDAAIQTHVLRQCGITVQRAEIMHLNKEFCFPDEGDLFQRTDVTTPVEQMLAEVPDEIERQLDALAGPLPEVAIGAQCFEPRECPFMKRCWPDSPRHISKLYNMGAKKTVQYMADGVHTIDDLPPEKKLPAAAKRQLRAMAEDRLIVEPELAEALEPFNVRLGYLDFETISRAVPVWPGMGPWHHAAAQYSYHEEQPDGTISHEEWLAEGPEDARPALAEAMVKDCAGASRVVMYTPFERTRIRDLQEAVPHLAEPLKDLESRLIDLHPIIRDYVYDPHFHGSFSLKNVLHPLVPHLAYHDLIIVDGMVASVEIARLLFVAGKIPPEQRDETRKHLLDYCERDTEAMVELLKSLRKLAGL